MAGFVPDPATFSAETHGNPAEETAPTEGAARCSKKSKKERCTYEEKIHHLVDDLRTQLLTTVNTEICDDAFGAIFGHPEVDPGPRICQLLWDTLERTHSAPERPANVPVLYELPPQDWERFSERSLSVKQKEELAFGRRKMEEYLLRTRGNFRNSRLDRGRAPPAGQTQHSRGT